MEAKPKKEKKPKLPKVPKASKPPKEKKAKKPKKPKAPASSKEVELEYLMKKGGAHYAAMVACVKNAKLMEKEAEKHRKELAKMERVAMRESKPAKPRKKAKLVHTGV